MPRPRNTAFALYRFPRWHARNGRWRLTISHHHGNKDFWWPVDHQTPTAPPEIIVAAVAIQKEWRQLVEQWDSICPLMEIDQPDKD